MVMNDDPVPSFVCFTRITKLYITVPASKLSLTYQQRYVSVPKQKIVLKDILGLKVLIKKRGNQQCVCTGVGVRL